MTKAIVRVFLCLAAACLWLCADVRGDAPVPVLILSGQNNHDWKTTTPVLKTILEDSGRFTVEVTDTPATLTEADLAKYRALVCNWNTFGAGAAAKDWPQALKSAFMAWLERGGGFVVVHAGGSMFYDWPDFQRVIGATWGTGTGHGPKHSFSVDIIDTHHPVTAGMAPFTTTDELWHRMATNNVLHVLASAFSATDKGGSGRNEPVAFVIETGKGRCFNLVLGHDVAAMSTREFRALLVRGTEWAATGTVTTPALPAPSAAAAARAIAAACMWRNGQDRAPVEALAVVVQEAATMPRSRMIMAQQLVAALSSNAAIEARAIICNNLGIVGGDAEVPALMAMLKDTDSCVHARAALERIPGETPLAAMRIALRDATIADRVGLVNSLAARRDSKAVPLLERLVADTNADVAAAAIAGLGAIGGTDAARILLDADRRVSAQLRPVVSAALLACADGLRADGLPAAALFTRLVSNDQPRAVRCAALSGYVAGMGDAGADALFSALSSDDAKIRAAAVRAFADGGSTQMVAKMAGRLSSMPPDLAVQVIAALGTRGDRTAAPAVVAALSSEMPEVRQAAIAAYCPPAGGALVPPPSVGGALVEA